MNATPWYRRMLMIRERWVIALLLVAAFVLGLVGEGAAVLAIKAALVVLAAAILVVALRRPET